MTKGISEAESAGDQRRLIDISAVSKFPVTGVLDAASAQGLAIKVEDLRKSYGDIVAVDGISFSVREHEIFGILGPNGAGKTTTVEILEGLRKADDGKVIVAGSMSAATRRGSSP